MVDTTSIVNQSSPTTNQFPIKLQLAATRQEHAHFYFNFQLLHETNGNVHKQRLKKLSVRTISTATTRIQGHPG